jgi:hypothetical protein
MRFVRDAIDLILFNGSRTVMVDLFRLSGNLGGGFKNELTCMLGYILAGYMGYIEQYSGAIYCLTEKGEREKLARQAKDVDA